LDRICEDTPTADGRGHAQSAIVDVASQLGRDAPSDPYLQRFLLDVAHGRTSIPPHRAAPALLAWARLDPNPVLRLLEDGGAIASVSAAVALGQGYRWFASALSTAGRSPNIETRLAAAAGLGEAAARGSADAAEALISMLQDEDGQVRWWAAVHLGGARGARCARRAESALAQAMQTGDDRTLTGAVFGLARLWPARKRNTVRLLREAMEHSQAARRAVALITRRLPFAPGRQLAKLASADRDPEVRALGAMAYAAWASDEPAAHRALASLAADSHPLVRAATAEGLAALPGDDGGLVERLAADPSGAVRAAVAEGLCRATDERHGALLAVLARDPAPLVRAAAASSLAGSRDQNLLRDLARDPHANVRAAAAAALGPGTARNLEMLLHMTEDRDPIVARAAARALRFHVTSTQEPAWQRLIALCHQTPVREAAAEAATGVLDRNAETAPTILWRWKASPDTAGALTRVARTATHWRVAEVARTLSHTVDPACDFAEAAEDAALALSMAGQPEIAGVLEWLSDCSRCTDPTGMAAAASRAPRPRSLAVLLLSLAGEAAGRGAQARRPADRQGPLGRAGAALDVILNRPLEDVAALCLQRGARLWQGALEQSFGAAQAGELRATLISRRVLCGPKARVAVLLENLAQHPLLDIQAACGGAEVLVALLEPGDSREVEVRCHAPAAGVVEVRGRGQYRAAGQLRKFSFGGAVTALRPGRLAPVPNPYVVGKPLAEDDPMFFGRSDEIASIERAVTAADSGSVVVVVGHRRTGKTSLLKRLAGRLAPSSRPAFIDMQGILASNTDAFLRELALPLLPHAESLSDGDASQSVTGADMVREAVARSERRIVLLLDEFDDLEQKVRSGLLDGAALDQLRHLVQHNRNLSVVLSGTHRIEELGGGLWSFLLNLATYRRIGCLSREEAEQVIREPLARLGIVCEDAAVTRAVRLTGGHPYFLQLLGYRIVESCVASGEAGVWADSVEEAAEQVVEQGDIHLRYLWESAGDSGHAIVKRLAEQGAALTANELREQTGASAESLHRVLERLTALEIVTQRAGRYALRMELLGRWLRRAQPGTFANPAADDVRNGPAKPAPKPDAREW
jgi:HEAT repeat protein